LYDEYRFLNGCDVVAWSKVAPTENVAYSVWYRS